MKIIIRADGNKKIGLGHVFRCANIAENLESLSNEIDISFITESDPEVKHTILGEFKYIDPTKDAHILEELIKYADIFISDILDTPNLYISKIRKINPEIKIICIDNNTKLKKINEADIVFNANIFPEVNYTQIDGTSYYMGPEYMILRKEFLKLRNKSKSLDINKLFISFGGSDEQGVTLKALQSVLNYESGLNVDIVVGPLFNFHKELNKLIQNNKRVKIYENPKNIIQIMASADLAIISAGITLYEICSLGIPSIVIPIALHQSDIAQKFAENKACLNVGKNGTLNNISLNLSKLMDNDDYRDFISNNAKNLVDGNGLNRFIQIIEGIINEKSIY